MVAEVLRPLLPSDAELPAGAWLEVNGPTVGSASGSSIEVEVRMVRPADHGVLARRGLTGLANCDDAARAAAVIAATWATRYRLSPSPPLSAPEVWTGPAGEGLVSSREPTKTRPTTLVWSVDAGVGVVGTSGGGGSASFATAGVSARRLSARWAYRVSLSGYAERTIPLGPGQVAWRRLTAAPGVVRAWGSPSVFLETELDLVCGGVFLSGRGFTQTSHSVALDVGGAPQIRVGARFAAVPMVVWIGGGALLWARQQQVRVEGVSMQGSLPRIDLTVGGGLAWQFTKSRPSRAPAE